MLPTLLLAGYFAVIIGCLVWQYRIARDASEILGEERAAAERYGLAVRLEEQLTRLFSTRAGPGESTPAGEVPEQTWKKIWSEVAALRQASATVRPKSERTAWLAEVERLEKTLGEVQAAADGGPDAGVSEADLTARRRDARNAAATLQRRADRLQSAAHALSKEPPQWQHDLALIIGALLLAGAGAGAIHLYHTVRRHQAEVLTRSMLIEQLRHTERKYREIFDHASEGIFQATPAGKYITANAALARMYGYDSPEHLIESLSEIGMQAYVQSEHRDAMLKTLETEGVVSNAEIEVVRADGRTLWVRQNVRAVRDEDGALLYFEGTVEDISDRWWKEQRRRVQQATGRVLETAQSVAEARPMMLNSICDILGWDMGAVWDVDSDAGVLRCVEVWHTPEIDIAEFEQILTRITLSPGQGLAGQIWAEGQPKWIANLNEDHSSPGALIALKNGMGSVYGVPIKVNGVVRHVAEFFSPQISVSDPELLQLFGVIGAQLGHLIERKSAEEALRKSEMRKAAILYSALDCIISFDAEGKILEFNPAAERAFGYLRQEALGRNISTLLIPEPAEDGTAESHNDVLLFGASYSPRSFGRRVEMIAMRNLGGQFPAEVAISRIKIDDKPMFTAFLRDISERKAAERVTSELAAVVQNSSDAIIGCSCEGIIQSWNAAAERIYGFTAAEVIGRPLDMLIPEERLDELPQTLTAIRRGEGIVNYETMRLRKDGKKIAVSLTESPIRSEHGRISGLSSIARDITERKRLEEELLQSQKMEAVGRLAGGIAHDFNNILTAILGYTDLIIGQIEERHWMYKHLCEVRKAADFAASLTQQLLAFSRRQPLFLRVFSINETVRGLQKMLQRVIGEQIFIKTELNAKVGRLKADPSQLEQVLLNLCVNSRDAMPGGGTITISSEDITYVPDEGSPGDLHLLDMPAGEYVRLSVSDTGTGIPPDVIKHIFEPFFTTKEKGQGTGLGLATCYGIVKQSGGFISVESKVGQGSTFCVFLPRVDESGAKTPAKQDQGQLPGGTETILYVEDEMAVRSLTSHVLRRLGYTVLEAESGEQARSIVQAQNGHRIDLLFSDVVLPDLSGKALADWIVLQREETKLLFTSGYVDEGVLRRHGVSSDMAFLRKPFSPSDLAHKLREVMDGTPVAN